MKKEIYLILAFLMLAIMACVCSSNGAVIPDTGDDTQDSTRRDDTQGSPSGDSPIGIIRELSEEVEVDQEPIPLESDHPILEGSEVGLFNGGEGLLNFGGALILHMFNNTRIGGVEAEADPNSSIFVRLRLELGGFTGELNEPGKQAVFETPNGAEIYIMGTEFFIVYDEGEDITTVGNFSGEIEISAGGETVELDAGYYLQVISNDQPEEQRELPFTFILFEDQAIRLQSPVQGLEVLLVSTPTSNPTLTNPPTITETPTPSPTPSPPDVVVTSFQVTGPGVFNNEGWYEVPVRVVVRNQGESVADNFKLSAEYAVQNGTAVVPFTVPGESNSWYPFINGSLSPGEEKTLDGKVTFHSNVQGFTLSLRVFADSCSGDENMPSYCRVAESDEANNYSKQATITLPAVLYDFVDKANSAQWVGTNGELPFPGGVSDDDGFALWQYEATLEDDSRPTRVLETHPTWVNNGVILGVYDLGGMILQEGDRVAARVGFLKGAGAGDVTFKLRFNYGTYEGGCGEFGCTWEPGRSDSYNNQLSAWEFDLLEEMIGEPLNSVGLIVDAGPSSAQDWAVWEKARIIRP